MSNSQVQQELAEELDLDVECLTDLTPCLEFPAPDPQVFEPYVAPTDTPSGMHVGVRIQPWCLRIIDMFPIVDMTLAERLGIMNWNRFEKLRRWASEPDPADTHPQEVEEGRLTSTLASTAISQGLSTGIQDTNNTEVTEPDIPPEPTGGGSDTDTGFGFGLLRGMRPHLDTDLETVFTASTQFDGHFRVPDIPPQGRDGTRTCMICKKPLDSSVNTRTAWKRHVYQDLEPYTCTAVNCPMSGMDTFDNRRAWAEHEFYEHLAEKAWMCGACSARMSTKESCLQHIERNHPDYSYIEGQMAAKTCANAGWRMKPATHCPLCGFSIGQSLETYAKHVGRHLEQIALISLRIHNFDEALEEGAGLLSAEGSESGIDENESFTLSHDVPEGEPEHKTTEQEPSAPEISTTISSTRNFEQALPRAAQQRPNKQRKIALVGSRSTDKSSIVVRFVEGYFEESYYPTIENTFSKTMQAGNSTYDVEIVDTVGQDEYSILNSKHFIGIHGYMLVYSVKSRDSFEMVPVIHDKILNHLGAETVPAVLVGNHSDVRPQDRQITPEEGKALSETLHCPWIEISSRYGENVEKAFKLLLLEIEPSQPPDNLQKQCVLM
ncbi:hypothetical protein OQA88_13452 [Cercophora sp. LCS_1]